MTPHNSRGGRSRPPGARVDPARLAAYTLLRAVAEDGAYANLHLPALLRERGIDGRDAAFATELSFGTLRLQGRYDAVIGLCSQRPADDIDDRVRDILRLGAHQILALDVPDYAAVSSSVALTRRVGRSGAAGFVNAVLRRIAADPLQQWLERIPPPADEDAEGHLIAVQSHPRWIAVALADALAAAGRRDELADLLAADNRPGQVCMVARPGRITTEELLRITGGSPGRWSPWAVRAAGDPGAWPPIRDGRAGVQDEGSQLIVLALSRAAVDCDDDRWLDMCAGPGGKAADLAGLAAAAGARLTAVEQHPHRARLVDRTLAGGPAATVLTGDARDADLGRGGFSRILVDAPCTGLGAIRRRPELRWRRTPADLPGLRVLQSDLLRRAADELRVGGVVAYATCSPHLAETEEIVARQLRDDPRLRQIDATALLPEVPDTGPGPSLRLWPHLHDTDGMYLAVLQRTA